MDKSITKVHNSLEHITNPHICLLQIGFEQCVPGHTYTNLRDIYLLHFIKSGSGVLEINNQTHILTENQMFLIRPNQPAIYTASHNEPWQYYYFAFNGAFAPDLIQKTVFKDDRYLYNFNDDKIADMIYDFAIKLKESKSPDIEGLEYLFKILNYMAVPDKLVTKKEELYKNIILPTQKYIENHYAEKIQIDDLAKNIAISPTYLHRVFKNITGVTPDKYLVSYRIQKAKFLLSTTEISIEDVCYKVGYNNYSPFYTAFKKSTGVSPIKYRDGQIAMKKYLGNEISQVIRTKK